MVPGETGRVGLSVPRPVVEDSLRGEENVTVLYLPLMVDNVGVILLRPEIVTEMNVSSSDSNLISK